MGLVLEIPKPKERPEGRFCRDTFERLSTDTLVSVRGLIDGVIDDRARQFDLFAEPEPAAAPELPAAPTADLAEVLSPSQVRKWLDCEASWYFKYLRDLPDPTNANRALGKAIHKAMELNNKHKIRTGADMDREEVLALYRESWAQEAESAVFEEGDDRAALEREGAVLVQKYHAEAAPEIQPLACEKRVAGTIGGVKVRGFIDLLDTNGCIIDLKTAAKKPSGLSPDYLFQVTTYSILEPGSSGKARVDTLVRTKTPQLVRQAVEITDQDRRYAESIYPLVQEQIRQGLYTPRRSSMFCSRSGCAYWQACEDEFGGRVKE